MPGASLMSMSGLLLNAGKIDNFPGVHDSAGTRSTAGIDERRLLRYRNAAGNLA
jgi:hypothetical protein